jgi:predicted O-methyltransferase YrrM
VFCRVELGAFIRRHNVYEDRRVVAAFRLLRRGASRVGLHVLPKSFYSAIPDVPSLPAGTFERRSPLTGLRLDLDAQLAWAGEHLAAPMRAFAPPDAATYGPVDSTVLYGMVRALRPARVVELGSGASTLVTAQALRANGSGELDVFDPYPGDGVDAVARLHRVRAQDVPLETFDSLRAGDVLFVDTTHTVKIGSDVNFVVLEVLPRLAPGVVVHFHDIFLPYEYPRRWLEDFGLYWAEQYLLQAFLSMNAGYEVLLAVTALARDRADAFAAILPDGARHRAGAAFWLRRAP